MAFGFPANFTESRAFHLRQDELAAIVRSALDSLGWRYEALPDNRFRAKVSISAASWGENLKVEILADGTVQVKSTCAYPLQCIDWGKNRQNVQIFFAQVEQEKELRLHAAASQKTRPAFDEKGRSPVERIFNEHEEE